MQNEATLEELFQRFRSSADHEALAMVFDRSAPRLLLIAAHVTPDPAAAEDLIQETFLEAMQRADQWDSKRPLLPWLSGILRHRAIDLARRLKHRRTTVPSELLEQAAALGGDPVDGAATEELLERVERALASLTSPFREALVLRIVHGLEPTEIAHALGRPPATVRGQLKRGLERIRKELPTSLAGALTLLLLPGTGIAGVRTTVLKAARDSTIDKAGSSAPTAESAVQQVVSSRSLTLLLGGLAAAALVWGLSSVLDPEVTPPANTGSNPVQVADGDRGADRDETTPSPARVVPNDETEPEDATGASTIRGRLVSADNGAPVVGGQVKISFGRGRFMTSDPTFRSYPEPLVFESDADGRFAASWTPSPLMRVYFNADGPGHTEASTDWTSVRNGLDVDVGNVALLRGTELRARCIDEQGTPVAGVKIEAISTSEDNEAPDSMFSNWFAYEETSGPDGVLAPGLLPAPDTYELSVVRGSGPWKVVTGNTIDLAVGPARLHDIVVAPATTSSRPSLRGRLIDTNGAPVSEGLALQIHADMPELGEAVTASDGSFELIPSFRGKQTKLCFAREERRYRFVEPDRKYPLGGEPVTVVVERLATFDVPIEVVDSRTGQPVERFGLRHEHDYWADERSFAIPPERFYWPAKPETHPGGRMVLEQLPVGRYRLSVHPEAVDLATSYMVSFEVEDEGAQPVRVELTTYAPLEVRVRDSLGQPVTDKKVRLVHLMASDSWAALFSVEELRLGVGGGRKMAVGLQEVRTDAEGRCRLMAPVDEPRLVLVLGGIGAIGERRELGAVPPGGKVLELEVPATAVVSGRIGPPDLLNGIGPSAEELALDAIVRPEDSDLDSTSPRLRLVGPEGERGPSTTLRPDGSFSFDEAPLGDWSLELALEWRSDSAFYENDRVTLAAIEQLQAGENRILEIDASHLVPTSLAGRVLVDGAPWASGVFGMVTSDPENEDSFDMQLTANGTLESVVREGRYLPFVTWDAESGREVLLFAAERVTFRAGEDMKKTFSFEHRGLRLRVRTPDGSVAPGLELKLRAIDFPEVQSMTARKLKTDGTGLVTLDPAPPGRIEVRTPEGTVLGLVTATARPAAAEHVLQLPR